MTVNQLVSAVTIALGTQAVGACAPADVDHDDRVSINELVSAVNAALTGCPGQTASLRPSDESRASASAPVSR